MLEIYGELNDKDEALQKKLARETHERAPKLAPSPLPSGSAGASHLRTRF